MLMNLISTNRAEQDDLLSVCKLLHGKVVLVLGSSPRLQLPTTHLDDCKVISVNASGVVARERGLPDPEVAVFGVSSLLKSSPHNRVIREKIKGLSGGHVFVRISLGGGWLKRSKRQLRSVRVLRKLSYKFDSASALGPKVWSEVVRDVMGEENLHLARNMSTGVFCIVLAIYAKAKEVAVSGIDPASTGHHYSTKNFERHHANSDKRMIDFLVKNYLVKIYLPDLPRRGCDESD